MAATKMTLQVQKATDNTIVFQESVDESDPLASRRVSGLYLPKHFLRELGFSTETPRLEITLQAVAGS